MTAPVTIKCVDVKIESYNNKELILDIEKITNIDANINDILYHYEVSDIAEYEHIKEVIKYVDTKIVLGAIDSDLILEHIANDNKLILELLDMVDEKFIMNKARKIKIKNLIIDEK